MPIDDLSINRDRIRYRTFPGIVHDHIDHSRMLCDPYRVVKDALYVELCSATPLES
jgi:hypothetical protein